MTWLLAALLTLCASQAVPVARSERTGDNCPIVWIAPARARAEQRVVIEKPGSPATPCAAVTRPVGPPPDSRLLSHSTYQRPPPFSLS
ncbi:MAG: hypothetical protein LAP38_24470 [Acidobacteriia bacterium]|nr:hypothetical protein [Terriglobia bacterium]